MNIEGGNSGKTDKYKVIFEPRAERDLDSLPPPDFRRIDKRILALEDDPRPRGAKKLGENYYRIRVGSWRVIYVVIDKDKTVIVSRIKRRDKSTYRKIP